MRRFLAGFMLGIACMYWYAYQKDAAVEGLKGWFANASHDDGAPKKVDAMFSKHH
jgi:hypothetical protein